MFKIFNAKEKEIALLEVIEMLEEKPDPNRIQDYEQNLRLASVLSACYQDYHDKVMNGQWY